MRWNTKLAAVITGVVALAAGSTIAMAAVAGAFTARTVVGHPPRSAPLPSVPTFACTARTLAGSVVAVTLTDATAGMMSRGRGPMMGNGAMMRGGGWWRMGMMSVRLSRSSVQTGTVSLSVTNTGSLTHELVVLPLPAGAQIGQRSVGSDARVSETGSLGEASTNCGADAGEGISPGGVSWTTLRLSPGRYELICNLPGHYAAGMYAELDVTG